MLKSPIRITVTGAAGQVAYSLLTRIALGEMLGKDQPVILQLLEIPSALSALKGVVMELEDLASPLLSEIIATDNLNVAFKGAEIILLVAAFPRKQGMERQDLLNMNASIFVNQGQAINAHAHPDAKILVVGNPANTNALIACKSAPKFSPLQFTAMMRLDHNRALAQLANHLTVSTQQINHLTVWGNHSPTMYPDARFVTISGKKGAINLNNQWTQETFIPLVAQRGTSVIAARGASSATSAASAAIDHMRDWHLGAGETWVSMGIYSDGSLYGIPEGIFFGMPCFCKNGSYLPVEKIEMDAFSQDKILKSAAELQKEAESIKSYIQ